MILADMASLLWRGLCSLSAPLRLHDGAVLPSAPVMLVIDDISCADAQPEPPAGPARGRPPWLLLGRRAGALVHAVGRLTADRRTGGADRHEAAGAPSPRRQPDRRGPDARAPRRGDPGEPGRGRGGPVGARRPTRRTPADGLVSHRRGDADAARDRHLPRRLSRGGADAGRG